MIHALAANPPEADARRTPYEITEVGVSVFDDWFTAQDAAAGAGSEDDISARALFIADSDPAVVVTLLDQLDAEFVQIQETLGGIFSGQGARIVPMTAADHYRHYATFLNPSLGERFD